MGDSSPEPTRPTGARTSAHAPAAEDQVTQEKQQGDDAALEGHDEYPEQRHAGRLDGVGPQYNAGGGLADKIGGLKDELKGKLKKDPELCKKGQERKTGELAKKKREGDQGNPFDAPEAKANPTGKKSDA